MRAGSWAAPGTAQGWARSPSPLPVLVPSKRSSLASTAMTTTPSLSAPGGRLHPGSVPADRSIAGSQSSQRTVPRRLVMQALCRHPPRYGRARGHLHPRAPRPNLHRRHDHWRNRCRCGRPHPSRKENTMIKGIYASFTSLEAAWKYQTCSRTISRMPARRASNARLPLNNPSLISFSPSRHHFPHPPQPHPGSRWSDLNAHLLPISRLISPVEPASHRK